MQNYNQSDAARITQDIDAALCLQNPTWLQRTTMGAVGVNICRMGTRLAVVMLVCESSHERNRKTIRDSDPAELD